MKKLFWILVYVPFITHAQTWQINISLGGTQISKPSDNALFDSTSGRVVPVIMFSVEHNISRSIRVGIDISAMDLVRQRTVTTVGTGKSTIRNDRIYVGSPAVYITPCITYHIEDVYFGVQAGLVTTKKGADYINSNAVRLYYDDYTGSCVGVHLGFTYYFREHVLLFGEGRAYYVHANSTRGVLTSSLDFLQVGVMAGFQINL